MIGYTRQAFVPCDKRLPDTIFLRPRFVRLETIAGWILFRLNQYRRDLTFSQTTFLLLTVPIHDQDDHFQAMMSLCSRKFVHSCVNVRHKRAHVVSSNKDGENRSSQVSADAHNLTSENSVVSLEAREHRANMRAEWKPCSQPCSYNTKFTEPREMNTSETY